MIKINLDNQEKFDSFCNLMENNISTIAYAIANRLMSSCRLLRAILDDSRLTDEKRADIFEYAKQQSMVVSADGSTKAREWSEKYNAYCKKYDLIKAKNL